jgi:hypothetical protein
VSGRPVGGLRAVVTTIQAPTPALRAVVAAVARGGGATIVVGDRPTPEVPWPEGARYLSLGAQRALGLRLPALLPERHYARKNVGYLLAAAEGAACVFDTDDDNAPAPGWRPRSSRVAARRCAATGWVNAYRWFTDEAIWPRGYPLELIQAPPPALEEGAETELDAPLQQALVDGSPDVDAVWRLTAGREFRFRPGPSVVLGAGAWCPVNSQSTWWFAAARPLLYLPSHVSFRMTDIWRGFVAQRCLWETGGGVAFHAPEMVQDRNPHDLLRDFEQEIPGYLGNARLCELLARTRLAGGPGAAAGNLHRCYEALVGGGFVPGEEMPLVEAWLADLEGMAPGGGGRGGAA